MIVEFKLNFMKYFIPIFILLCFISSSANSQNVDKRSSNRREKVEHPYIIGGGLGLQFGTITFIELSPKVGYRLTEHFTTGLGGTYQYFRDRRAGLDYSTTVYGGALFAQHDIWNNFYAYAEFEYLTYEDYYNVQVVSENILIGGGYKQWLSSRAYAYLSLLYNINETYKTPYSNPVFRTGFIIRL